ncbi:aminoglycoside phosphotransferase family protein [uncultured Alsobacter sp.]|uniref:aminoglycoside phosphotransferase family protein n=1 Tax=uncultured Alsobacter sp. TaxID=1748258 RepID=UPI0025F40B0C|nr:aminoglycoside phosphotransferase family protein [uncultured Alsobacter sp.]
MDAARTALEAISTSLARCLGSEIVTAAPVRGGYTQAERWLVTPASGRRVFVKIATSPMTRTWMKSEIAAYGALSGGFMPRLVVASGEGAHPFLVLEDLSGATWPPAWSQERVARVLDALEALHASRAALPPFATVFPEGLSGWKDVAADPAPLLSLGLVSPEWLAANLPLLRRVEDAFDPAGSVPLHLDVRSDNLCFRDGTAKLVDWNFACLGNPRLDAGFWLPSLEMEGGPSPESVMPDAADVAVVVSGYFAARAGLPAPSPALERIRALQKAQLRCALGWVTRANRLAP